jgi:hypothetical protein
MLTRPLPPVADPANPDSEIIVSGHSRGKRGPVRFLPIPSCGKGCIFPRSAEKALAGVV